MRERDLALTHTRREESAHALTRRKRSAFTRRMCVCGMHVCITCTCECKYAVCIQSHIRACSTHKYVHACHTRNACNTYCIHARMYLRHAYLYAYAHA